jgi:hypothetical protein
MSRVEGRRGASHFIDHLIFIQIQQNTILVYGVTNVDGSGYNRMDDDQGIKSKVGGAIINEEYRSQKTKAST